MNDETRAGSGETQADGLQGPRLTAGSEFAGHRVESELGRGGMGVVYRAHHLALDAPRALKVVAPALSADSVFRERFKRESRLAASIEHPNVIAAHNAGEENGLLYLSMRLVAGSDLKEIIETEGPLDAHRTASVISAVAAGLDAAHSAGLVHRDVKPANVLIEPSPRGERVFLTDFGISRISSGGSTVTSAGELLGSVDYIAPEQIEGNEVGPQADIYSLGCLAYFALIGEPPFVRDHDLARLYAHANAQRPQPSRRREGLPRKVDSVIARAMSIAPGDRYTTAEQMAGDLQRALRKADPNESETTRIVIPEQPSRRRRRVKFAAGVGGLLALAAAAVVLFLVLGEDTAKTPLADGKPAKIAATIKVDGRPDGIAVGENRTWVASTDQISSIDLKTNKVEKVIGVDRRPVSVAVDFGAVWVVDREGGAVVKFQPVDGKSPVAIPTGADPSDVVTAYGSVWVANEGDNTVSRIDPETNKTKEIPLSSDSSPRSIAAGGGGIWVANIGNGTVSRIEPGTNVIDSDPIEIGGSPNDLDFGAGSLWVSDVFSGKVFRADRVDPADSKRMEVVGNPIDVGARPRGIKVGFGSVWVASGADDTVTRIDAESGQVIGDPIEVGDQPADIAVGDGSVWTADSGSGAQGDDPSVTRIDP